MGGPRVLVVLGGTPSDECQVADALVECCGRFDTEDLVQCRPRVVTDFSGHWVPLPPARPEPGLRSARPVCLAVCAPLAVTALEVPAECEPSPRPHPVCPASRLIAVVVSGCADFR